MVFDRKYQVRRLIAHSGSTLAATLAVQVSTFIILLLSAQVLSTEQFARLSLIVAVSMMSSAFFELGLNVTATKVFGESRDPGVFGVTMRIRLGLVLVALGCGAVFRGVAPVEFILGFTLGAVLNVWNGVRAEDQARQCFREFAKNSLLLAVVRLVVALPLLFVLQDAIWVAIGIYFLPVAVVLIVSSAWRRLFTKGTDELGVASVFAYAKYVYPNALIFIALPYLPQLLIAESLPVAAGASYGLVIAFSGPVGLLIYSLRATLLPKLFGQNGSIEALLWSWRGFAILAIGWVFLMLFGIGLSIALDVLYGDKFFNIGEVFLIYFACTSFAGVIGIYGLSVHTLGVPQLSLSVSVGRLVGLVIGLLIFHETLIEVVVVVSCVMVLGEMVLVVLLARRRRRVGL